MNINVSIDAKGNLVCDNSTGSPDASITWVPDPNTISNIQSITLNVGSFIQAPTARNSWAAILGGDGNLGNNQFGWDYTIVANSKSGGAAKQKSPKIVLSTPNKPVHH